MARNRVIYQSEAVYVGPSPAVSGFFSNKNMLGWDSVDAEGGPNGESQPLSGSDSIGSARELLSNDIIQLHRIQTCNYSFNIARTDINQFGELAAIDRVIMDTPTVALDFSYILATMDNEARLGFTVNKGVSCISGILNKVEDERNYFIKTVAEGEDAVGDLSTAAGQGGGVETDTISTIGIGNGFMTSYSTECSVGNFPTCSVSVEGMNMTFNNSISGASPAVVPESGTRLDHFKYCVPVTTGSAETGFLATSALRPGDITFEFQKVDAEGIDLDTAVVGGLNSYDAPGATIGDMTSKNHAKIQSYNISLDLGREPIQRLGSRFAFTREITFPMTVSCSIDALVADLTTGSLSDIVNCDDSYDITINLLRPTSCPGSLDDGTAKQIFAQYAMKNVKVDAQSFSSDIGSNKSVTLDFSTQVGGPNQTNQGLFMSGISLDFIADVQQDTSAQS
jgi:hypothetical protein